MKSIDYIGQKKLTAYTQNSEKNVSNLSQNQGVKKQLNYKKPFGLCLSCEYKNLCEVTTDTRAEVLHCSYKNFYKAGLVNG